MVVAVSLGRLGGDDPYFEVANYEKLRDFFVVG